MRPPSRPEVAWRSAVLATGAGALLVATVPDPSRPVLVAAAVAVAACLAAAVSGRRPAGTIAVGAVAAAVLLAQALGSTALRPVQLVAASGLLLGLVTALDRVEAAGGPPWTVVAEAPLGRRLGAPLAGLAGAALVATAAEQDVVPSVATVLAGVSAAVTALVVAVRVHRN